MSRPGKVVESWGRYPRVEAADVQTPQWSSDLGLNVQSKSVLAHGCGRSYGDVCLNEGGRIVLTTNLDRFLAFHPSTGILRAEAGVTLEDVLSLVVPHGWFLPVTPGTRYVSLGGAVANDIHGKNHHVAGTFGCHVRALELVRSDGSRTRCSPYEHQDLFAATIGGLGLTGIISWVEIQLTRIMSVFVQEVQERVDRFDDLIDTTISAEQQSEYVVSWFDVTVGGSHSGRGLVLRGDFVNEDDGSLQQHVMPTPRLSIPFEAPSWLLSRPTIRMFNEVWYRRSLRRIVRRRRHYVPFFYPLDAIARWNLLYGRRGMLQYQCVVPFDGGREALREIIGVLHKSGVSSFLAVVKTFGDVRSPGMLSFPRPGLTLTLDMPNIGAQLLTALDRCDRVVREVGGRIYPAKDARMSSDMFLATYPEAENFVSFIDPHCSSSFWRRVWKP